MEGSAYLTKMAILRRAQEIIGIPLGKIDKNGRLSTGKGAIGTMIEESWYGYSPNSESEPDFPEAGVELKVAPYLRRQKGIRAKERLVCNIINYMLEYERTFETSSFWHKCNTMLLMSYEHIQHLPKTEYYIDKAILFCFPEEDLIIIKQDWERIMEKVRSGLAHEISEGDTMYLAACTKGATAASVRQQPFSTLPAKQRAYSLKASYMTQILNKFIFGEQEDEHIIKDWQQLENRTFEDFIIEKVSPYFGKTQSELKRILGVSSTAKNLNELLLAKMLGVDGKISNSSEFKKANIVPKTIRIQRNGSITECMSFPKFDFIKLSQESTWEESELYNYLAPKKFLFVIFQQNEHGEYVFNRVQFWNISNDDLDEVGRVWARTVQTIREGVILMQTARGVRNNLPKVTESAVAHVRPHGRDGSDKAPLPDGRMMTKQCFWLNNSFIKKQILG